MFLYNYMSLEEGNKGHTMLLTLKMEFLFLICKMQVNIILLTMKRKE